MLVKGSSKKEEAMRRPPGLPIEVRSLNERELEARLEPVQERTRRRAYELYCARVHPKATALDDWIRAEHERNVTPLAGVAHEDTGIRITACVPGANASDLAVDVLPNEVVLEADRDGRVERFTRIRLPAKIDIGRVKARLRGSELEIVAPKAASRETTV
jgi:HSP20 family molecular chaperone IbpA